MPLSYSNNLRLTLIGNGEQAGTWGDLTNINLGTLLEQAISGYTTVSMLDANYTLTTSSGATDEARSMGLNITSSVTLTATRNVIVPTTGSPPTSAPYTKLYVVRNATTGGQSIVIKTSAGSGITIANGATAIVLCNGTDVIDPSSSKQAALGYTPVNKAGDTMSGGLGFTGSATRIQGDFSNATLANRTAFQDKTTNTATQVNSLPNGSAVGSGFVSYASSDPTNSAYGSIYCDSSSARISSAATGSGTALPLVFNISGLEIARFLTNGAFCVGTAGGYTGNSQLMPTSTFNVGIATGTWNNVGNAIDFSSSIGGAYVYAGSVSLNGASASYNSVSDYRLKNSPQALTGSGAFIDALQPKTWTWAGDGTAGVGFIAHEVAAISSRSVNGEKDAVNADGTPKYQSMEYGSPEFIANIVAELQSLRARVAALEAK
jgi:hypothetical protein